MFPGALLGADRTRTRKERNVATATEVFTGSVSAEEIEQRRQRDDRARGGSLAGALVRNALDRRLDWADQPMPGRYAAGSAVALVDLGFGYEGGKANGRSQVYGFCAAEHAATGDSGMAAY